MFARALSRVSGAVVRSASRGAATVATAGRTTFSSGPHWRAVACAVASTVAVGCGASIAAAEEDGPGLPQGGGKLPTAPHSEVLRMPGGFEKVLRNTVQAYPDFPIEGVLFQDVFPIFRKPALLHSMVNLLCLHTQSRWGKPDVIVGLDSRGFLIGPMMAVHLGCSFVPVRKKGKLPGEVFTVSYRKEYGSDEFEVQKGAFPPGSRVVIVDDLMATGGTMKAAVKLIESAGGEVLGCLTLIEIADLEGYKQVPAPTFTLMRY